jgi:hypothetical protein
LGIEIKLRLTLARNTGYAHKRSRSPAMAQRKQNGACLVGAQTVAAHLTMSRANVRYFTERGLFVHRGANGAPGYDLDQCRGRYLEHLREEYRRSPRAEADGELA